MAFSHGTPNSIVTDGLVFCVDAANKVSYPGSGTDCFNLIDSNITGSLRNEPPVIFNPGNSGNFGFGVDEFIDFGYPSSLLTTGGLTVSFWAKTSIASNVNDTPIGMDVYSTSNRNWHFNFINTGELRWFIHSSPSAQLKISSATARNGNWHNITGTYIPTTSLNIYIDGNLEDSNTTSIPSSRNSNNANLWFGKDSFNNYFTGNIGPVQIYNRGLSSTEVTQNYNALKNRFRT
jgi:hypothetical protein